VIALLALSAVRGLIPFIGAAIGAAIALWGWRMVR
jgi:hypothetical protein